MPFFRPDLYYRSVPEIDLDGLKARGIRLLMLDLDNTLVPRNTTDAESDVHEWVQLAKSLGFGVTIVSNNWHERVQHAADSLGVAIEAKGTKPFPGVFRRALASTGVSAAESAIIGDQIFTDMLGGRFIGATRVLVTPLAPETDPAHTRLLRILERRILRGRTPELRDDASPRSAGRP